MKLKFHRRRVPRAPRFSDDWLYKSREEHNDYPGKPSSERHPKRCPECGGILCTLPR